MYKLQEVQDYLKKLKITEERIEECYNLIPDPEERVNDQDEMWVACTVDHEKSSAYKAIKKIVNSFDTTITDQSIKDSRDVTCDQFKNLKLRMKHRIPFYVIMLDKLI